MWFLSEHWFDGDVDKSGGRMVMMEGINGMVRKEKKKMLQYGRFYDNIIQFDDVSNGYKKTAA